MLFMANTGLRPDEAKNLQHRHVTVVQERDTDERILEIEVRPSASARAYREPCTPYQRLLKRAKPVTWRDMAHRAAYASASQGFSATAVRLGPAITAAAGRPPAKLRPA